MAKIAEEAEDRIKYEKKLAKMMTTHVSSVPTAISLASVTTAFELGATAIITATVSGSTAKNVSKFRPECPILAITPSKDVARKLSLYWGVYPIVAELYNSTDEMIDSTADIAKKLGFVKDGDLVIITAGLPLNFIGSTNMIKVHLIGEVLLQGKKTNDTKQVVSGIVKKVTSHTMADEVIENGDILVVNSLTDAYINILHKVSGVIVETNQVMPAISVEAMKLDIPVVAEAVNALGVLTEGTLVTIDGKRSLVINGRTALKS